MSVQLSGRWLLLLAEISDLLITTQKVKDNAKRILNLTQLSFHQIRKDEITQVRGLSPESAWSGGARRETRSNPRAIGVRGDFWTSPSPTCTKSGQLLANCWSTVGHRDTSGHLGQ